MGFVRKWSHNESQIIDDYKEIFVPWTTFVYSRWRFEAFNLLSDKTYVHS